MIIFIVIWALWFLSEILINLLLRSGKKRQNSQDKGSIRVIWIAIGIANTSGIVVSAYHSYPISVSPWLPYLGLFVIVLGMFIRIIAIKSLGKLFTVDVTIRENHTIKKDGIYSITRHPSYTGSLLSFFGFGLSLNNWVSLVIISFLVTAAMLWRIHIEEKLLQKQFGQDYSEYMKKTYRLIPWLY